MQRTIVKCPSCGKRVVDVESKNDIVIYIKCPHCKKEHRIEW